MQPHVTAVMITGKHPSRRKLAELSVESFRRQTYENADLLIINDSGERWFANEPRIEEVQVAKQPTLGHLRNLGLSLAKGDLIMQWDDDDWHGLSRISRQVEGWRPGRANILRNEILCDLATKTGLVVSAAKWRYGGFPGTILHPQTKARYPETPKGEDTVFLRHWGGVLDSIDNSTADYVRFVHDSNTWDRGHFTEIARDKRELNYFEVKELNHVLWMVEHETRQATSLEDVQAVCGNVKWMTAKRGHICGELIRDTEQRRVLEIGHLHGVSTCYLALAGVVTTIDLPQSINYAPRVDDTLSACGLSARIIRHPGGSLHACFELLEAGERFDFAYIDGCHYLPAVVHDFALVDALLVEGGRIAFDDVANERYPDVRRFADAMLSRSRRYQLTTPDDNLIVARKIA